MIKKKVVRWTAGLLLFVLLMGVVISWSVAGWLIAATPTTVGPPPDDFPANVISFPSESGSTIHGWHRIVPKSRGVIVLVHGIRGSRLAMLRRARFLVDAGFSVVLIDLQAHGESPGEQITLGFQEKHDVCAAVEYTKKQHPEEPVGVLGVSLGAASTLLASPLNVDAVVIESTYPTIEEAVHNRVHQQLGVFSFVPAKCLLIQLEPRLGVGTNDLRPIDRISEIDCPVFVISGSNDQHTTAKETQQLYDRAGEPKELWLVEGAEHESLFAYAGEEYQRRVLSFFRKHLIQSKAN